MTITARTAIIGAIALLLTAGAAVVIALLLAPADYTDNTNPDYQGYASAMRQVDPSVPEAEWRTVGDAICDRLQLPISPDEVIGVLLPGPGVRITEEHLDGAVEYLCSGD